MNWITHTRHPRATARMTTPKAAVDLPFPSPVLTKTSELGRTFGARGRGGGGAAGSFRGVMRPLPLSLGLPHLSRTGSSTSPKRALPLWQHEYAVAAVENAHAGAVVVGDVCFGQDLWRASSSDDLPPIYQE